MKNMLYNDKLNVYFVKKISLYKVFFSYIFTEIHI